MSKKNKSYWNFRVLTRMVPGNLSQLTDKTAGIFNDWREFFIAEVYYKNGEPSSYKDANLLSGWDSLKDLKWTAKHVKEAFKKPVLDTDNWPKKFKDGK